MANLEEVMVENREGEGEESMCPTGEDPPTGPRKSRRRSRRRRNSSDSDTSVQKPRSGQGPDPDGKLENGNRERGAQPVNTSRKPDPPPTEEDYKTKFYELYRREAEEYDREFIKRYDEDLNTTLIFAGLFSAVTSAFIIQVQPQLQSDPNEETAALLRVLIYKIDNTTFGNNIPAVPQWSGPPYAIIQVQAILYASLAASLFSALLAMLGKQWLNRYVSVDMRGSAIERSQDRQRKLDGIVTWYFDHVMELLPLMLQFGLLLLGCALSRYLWEIDTTVAWVVLGVTLFGAASYGFFVVAGAASSSCPYQTPGAQILRHTLLFALGVLHSAFSHSHVIRGVANWWYSGIKKFKCSISHVADITLLSPFGFSINLAIDVHLLARAAVRTFVAAARRVRGWFRRAHGQDKYMATLDLQCISWMLQTSSDKNIHLPTLKLLAMMTTLANIDPALVSACFDILAGCMSIVSGKVVILQGTEELAAISAQCCLRTLPHLTTADPASTAFKDIRRQYTKTFPIETNFSGLPFYHRFCIIHNIFYSSRKRVPYQGFHYRNVHRPKIQWRDYELSTTEHVVLVQLAQFEYRRKQTRKVPRWILRYVFHLLSRDPLPPTSVVADCLSIIAMDLGCAVSSTTTLNESARLEDISNMLTRELGTMVCVEHPDQIISKHKAILALLPYAAWRERGGDNRMVDGFLGIMRVRRGKRFMARPIAMLLGKADFEFPSRVTTLVSPYADWGSVYNTNAVARWAAAASTTPYTEEVCQSVVDTLLQIAFNGHLQPYIPVDIWAWLKKRPSLPPICRGRHLGTECPVVRSVRELGDVEILESFLLLVWSEWDHVSPSGLPEICTSIREDFGGIGMGSHREVLINRLDHVLGELDRGVGHLEKQNPSLGERHIRGAREDYGGLKEELLEVDREALEILTQSHSTFICALPLLCP